MKEYINCLYGLNIIGFIKINENVYVFSDEECEQINNSIESFQINSNGIVINMLQNVPFDNLEDGSLFFVKGTSDSVFGVGYFGKITSRTNGEGYTSYVIETPLFEEVFDRIKFNATQTLNYNDISKFVVPTIFFIAYCMPPFSTR